MALTDEGIIEVPGLASRWVRLASGAKAHYVTSGDKGPAVLLLHGGLPGSSGTAGWRFMAPFLGANGNYTNGFTSSLLGHSAYCLKGVNQDKSHGIVSGCE